MSESQAKQQSICVIRTSSIGDVILASACLDLATRLGVHVVWLGRYPTLRLLQLAYPHMTFVEMPKRLGREETRATWSKIGKVSAVVDLQCNIRSRSYLRMGAKHNLVTIASKKLRLERMRLIGMAWIRRRLFPKPEFQRNKEPLQYRTMLDSFAEALRAIGLNKAIVDKELQASRPNLNRLAERQVDPSWGNELGFGRWIALAPGAAYATKQCPKEIWIDVLSDFKRRFQNDSGAGLMVVGGDKDRRIAIEILDAVSWPWPVLNLAGKISLEDSGTALARSEILLTNDSGLLHLSEAVGTPVLSVFGPTVEEFGFAPWHPGSDVVSSSIGCRPCSRHGKLECRFGDKLCFSSLPQHKITRRLSAQFNTGSSPRKLPREVSP